jgi:hypothetical protein
MANKNKIYCDDCGREIASHESAFFMASICKDVSSANKGESATICEQCAKEFK